MKPKIQKQPRTYIRRDLGLKFSLKILFLVNKQLITPYRQYLRFCRGALVHKGVLPFLRVFSFLNYLLCIVEIFNCESLRRALRTMRSYLLRSSPQYTQNELGLAIYLLGWDILTCLSRKKTIIEQKIVILNELFDTNRDQ